MSSYFHFPELPNRPVRPLSWEQEVPYDASDVGYAIDRPSGSYHSGRGGMPGVYVEADGSCGCEVVYSMLPLATAQGAQEARDVWQAVKDYTSRVTTACGMHVHVDPTPCDFSVLQSLYHLYNGLEDPLYRLGGSGYTTGHRDNGYCPATPKGHERAYDIGSAMGRDRYGLNLSRILRAMLRCTCGAAQYGAWSECRCGHASTTVEFRVWNGTRNARKAHGYIALSLGLVAEASRIRYDRKRVGVLEWVGESSSPAPSRMLKATERILSLPMSAFDRECVMYLVRGSTIPRVIGTAGMAALEAQFGTGGAVPPDGWRETSTASRSEVLA